MRTLNLGILAHVDAGKTTLTEHLLHAAGVIDAVGAVDDGTTQTDSMALEQQRGITIKSAVVSFVVDDVTINLIDTPGHPDFIAEVERVLNVLDGVVLVISAVEGVQPQTRILMRVLKRLRIPTLIFVNKIDRAGARYEHLLNEISERLDLVVIPMGAVIHIGTHTAGFTAFGSDEPEHATNLSEVLAEQNEAFLTAYIDNATPQYSELHSELIAQTKQAIIHPVFFGSAITGVGVNELIPNLIKLLPTVEVDAGGKASGIAFKVERSPKGEKIAYVRMFTGTIRTRERVQIGNNNEQRITSLQVFEQGAAVPSTTAHAGQIAKIWGLSDIQIGDTLGIPRIGLIQRHFAQPTLETVIVPKVPNEKGALHIALTQLAEQDPLIDLRQDDVHGELYVSLSGEVQKEVIQETLANDFAIDVQFRETSTICIERPTGKGTALEQYGKGGNPFPATIGLRVEPGAIDSGLEFQFEVDPGSMPLYIFKTADEFQNTLITSINETLHQGLRGWQVIDCKITLTHSGYAPPSSAIASDYRYLMPLVLMRALKMAGTAVCEPVHRFRIDGPASALGPTLRELGRLDAVPTTTSTRGSNYTVEGEILATRMHQLQLHLLALTHGEGVLEFALDHYRPVRGTPPSRPRTDNNPLNFKEYMSHVPRRA